MNEEWYCAIQGKRYGPISRADLEQWIREGRVARTDLVWKEGMADWVQAAGVPELQPLFEEAPPASVPVPPPPPPAGLRPHRGVLILVLGILGLVFCCAFGIAAWAMGNSDLREMDEGRMDPSGRGMTNAGRICGMISVILTIAWLVFFFVFGGIFGSLGSFG